MNVPTLNTIIVLSTFMIIPFYHFGIIIYYAMEYHIIYI